MMASARSSLGQVPGNSINLSEAVVERVLCPVRFNVGDDGLGAE